MCVCVCFPERKYSTTIKEIQIVYKSNHTSSCGLFVFVCKKKLGYLIIIEEQTNNINSMHQKKKIEKTVGIIATKKKTEKEKKDHRMIIDFFSLK